MTQAWRRFIGGGVLLLPTLALLWSAGCSSEGGVVGSGISSAVQGTVIDVQTEIPVADGTDGEAAAVTPVLVSIDEAPDLAPVETADDGSFEIRGDFAGRVTVRFREPDPEAETLGTETLDVAAGSTVFLPDVEIRRDQDPSVHLGSPAVFNLAASLREVLCDSMLLYIADDAMMPNQFVLQLLADTEIVASDGSNVECADLRAGMRITLVEGVLQAEAGDEGRVVAAVKLVVNPEPDGEVPAEIRIRRHGVVLRAECDAGVIRFADENAGDLVRVEINPATRFDCPGLPVEQCGCGAIDLGDGVEVDGLRRMKQPGSIAAIRIVLTPNAGPEIRARISGDVDAIDCATGVMTVSDMRLHGPAMRGLPRDVLLVGSTAFTCLGGPPGACGCTDVGLGDRVDLDVRVPLLPPGPPEAVEVRVVAVPEAQASGVVIELNCALDEIALQTRAGSRVRVQLQALTQIELPGGGTLSCDQLRLGDVAVVHGRRLSRLDQPVQVILADHLLVPRAQATPTPQTTPSGSMGVHLVGQVVAVQCPGSPDDALRVLDARGHVVNVRLGADTMIRRGSDTARCEEIQLGEHVSIRGMHHPSNELEIDADEVRLPRDRS